MKHICKGIGLQYRNMYTCMRTTYVTPSFMQLLKKTAELKQQGLMYCNPSSAVIKDETAQAAASAKKIHIPEYTIFYYSFNDEQQLYSISC